MSYENPFSICCGVEAEGHKMIQPLLKDTMREWIPTHHASIEYQVDNGDYVGISAKTGELLTIELKTEKETTGNLFIETWSNVNRKSGRLGWIHTSKADWIWYAFLDQRKVYALKTSELWEWCINQGNIYKHKYRVVGRPQRNKTSGHCVPIEVLKSERVVSLVWKEGEFCFEKIWTVDSVPHSVAGFASGAGISSRC